MTNLHEQLVETCEDVGVYIYEIDIIAKLLALAETPLDKERLASPPPIPLPPPELRAKLEERLREHDSIIEFGSGWYPDPDGGEWYADWTIGTEDDWIHGRGKGKTEEEARTKAVIEAARKMKCK